MSRQTDNVGFVLIYFQSNSTRLSLKIQCNLGNVYDPVKEHTVDAIKKLKIF